MSCCGVLVSRDVYDAVGGWPTALGIYGGGEHFLNFTTATMGMRHWVMPGPALHHYATHRGRGYHHEWGDYHRNRAVASYMFGGQRWLEMYCLRHNKYERAQAFFDTLLESVPLTCEVHRRHVEARQTIEVEDWVQQWLT